MGHLMAVFLKLCVIFIHKDDFKDSGTEKKAPKPAILGSRVKLSTT